MTLLKIDHLEVAYPGRNRRQKSVRVLKDISLDIRPGETVGLVGESGSGKSTMGRAILGLAPVSAGTISLAGREITHATRAERRELSSDVQAVFQDPYSSLNPSMTIGQILSEPLFIHGYSKADARRRIREILGEVGLPRDSIDRWPREFSGGQRQRIAIARAVVLEPKLIVCDEPVSALDLSTQAQVLELLLDLQERLGTAYLFISHDLSVVRYLSHRVAVLFKGEIVEWGEGAQVALDPQHPYTKRLLMSAPVANPDRQAERRAERLASRVQVASQQQKGLA